MEQRPCGPTALGTYQPTFRADTFAVPDYRHHFARIPAADSPRLCQSLGTCRISGNLGHQHEDWPQGNLSAVQVSLRGVLFASATRVSWLPSSLVYNDVLPSSRKHWRLTSSNCRH